MGKKPIYVEIQVGSTVDKVWHYTQQPDLHEQWDLQLFRTGKPLPLGLG